MEPNVVCVPHMFVQRVDALPEDVLEGVLTALAPQPEERRVPDWLRALGWGQDALLASGDETLSKAALRDLLRKRRRDELAADADTADYSSEPYDSIPRQVQLQYRVFARFRPEEFAEREKLANMLPPSPSWGTQLPGVAWRGSSSISAGNGGSTVSSLFGALPSVTSLQQYLRNLLPPNGTTVITSKAPARNGLSAAAAPSAFTSVSGEGGGTLNVRATLSAEDSWRRRDPVVQKLSRSLDVWYDMHREACRPLRRGQKARLLVVRGIDLPQQWKASMRPAPPAPSKGVVSRGSWVYGCLRACSAVVAGVAGLRRGPRVWEVETAESPASESVLPRLVQQQGWQERGGSGVGSVGRPLRAPAAAEVGGLGLVAATAAARGLHFALRKTTLIPPEWLEED